MIIKVGELLFAITIPIKEDILTKNLQDTKLELQKLKAEISGLNSFIDELDFSAQNNPFLNTKGPQSSFYGDDSHETIIFAAERPTVIKSSIHNKKIFINDDDSSDREEERGTNAGNEFEANRFEANRFEANRI